jgi:hypothetical protein
VRGKLATPLWRGQLNVKRRIKHSLYARQTVDSLRRHLLGEGRAELSTTEAVKLQSVA